MALIKVKAVTTLGTMFISIVAYALAFGWPFAVGFVLLLFVHEMGHVIQLRREGVDASAPIFRLQVGAEAIFGPVDLEPVDPFHAV